MNRRDASARMHLASLLIRSGRDAEALPHLIAAGRLSPLNPDPHRSQAEIYRRFNYLDRELDSLRALLAADSSDWRAALRMSQIYQQVRWFAEARAALDRAIAVRPQEPEVLIAQATFEFHVRNIPGMRRLAEEGIRHWPQESRFYVIRGEAHRLENRLPEAEKDLRQAVAAAASDSEAAADLASLAHLLLANEWSPPRYADAEAAARAALEREPSHLEARYWLARALDLQGMAEKAEPHYAQVLKQDVRFEATPLHLGRIYLRSQDPAKRAEGERLVRLYPQLERNAREFARADEQLRNNPANSDAHGAMGRWYLQIGQPAPAILEFRRVLMAQPDDRVARAWLAKALRASGRETEARELDE